MAETIRITATGVNVDTDAASLLRIIGEQTVVIATLAGAVTKAQEAAAAKGKPKEQQG
jgi:hypothetical protein